MKERLGTFMTCEHGPVIVARIIEGTPTKYECLTWDAKHVSLLYDELLPFPRTPTVMVKGPYYGTSGPDYSVRGVREISDLLVDCVEQRPSRSLLMPFLIQLEREGHL